MLKIAQFLRIVPCRGAAVSPFMKKTRVFWTEMNCLVMGFNFWGQLCILVTLECLIQEVVRIADICALSEKYGENRKHGWFFKKNWF